MKTKFNWARCCAVFAAAAMVTFVAKAETKTFRWSNDGDPTTMDPHARRDGFVTSFDMNMYEPLLRRDRNLKLEPALATEWSNPGPTTWRFRLRHDVKFHDGTPLTADDVVFSMQRAVATGADVAALLTTVKEVKKIDDYTVDFLTDGPSPILPNYLVGVAIMSKSWCEAHGTTFAASHEQKENYATRNENGTGPFILKDREVAVRTVLVKNPAWWGLKDQPIEIDEVVFTRIANAATRAAALLSGELDMIYNVPLQDVERIRGTPGMKIWQTPELRTIFLGMDQSRPELLESNIKGKNPFKDQRVRQAFYEAICQAVVAMLARIGVKVDLLAQTKARYFGKINAPAYNTSFYLLGWTPTPLDALNMLSELASTRSGDFHEGIYNDGGYSNPSLDEVIKQIEVELDGEKRNELISKALSVVKDDFAYIPLHQQIIVWASRDNVELAPMGND